MPHVEIGMVGSKERVILTRAGYRDTQRAKRIPGASAKWVGRGVSKQFDFWHYPLDLTTCKLLREEFPDLELGPVVESWARKEKAHRQFVKSLHLGKRMKPIELEHVPNDAPKLWAAMQNRGYQTIVPAFAKYVGSHFNADQPGLGKTIEELGALVECQITGKILIVAPRKALRATWAPEIRKWLFKSKFKIRIKLADSEEGSTEDREKIIRRFIDQPVRKNEMHFLLINPEMVRWTFDCYGDMDGLNACNGNKRGCPFSKAHTKTPRHKALNQYAWDGILVDETHKFLMNANERSASASQVGYGLQHLPDKGYKVGMSGTPFKGKPRRFWMVLHWLAPQLYTAQGKWQETFFETEESSYTYSGKAITENMRRDRVDMFNENLGQIMIRRTKRELRQINPTWAPPDKMYSIVKLKMDGKQQRAYNQMRDDALADIEGGRLVANGLLAEMTRLKQFASAYGRVVPARNRQRWLEGKLDFSPSLPSCKWDWIKNVFLEERGILDSDGEIKVIIASQYTSILHMYADALKKLKVPFYLIEGPTKDIDKIQRDWQSKQTRVRVCLLSIMAGGFSLNLDAADDIVMNDETFVPDDNEQAEDRAHRTSRTDHQVTVYRLCTINTLDESIIFGNDEIDNVQKSILDGRRGQDYTKQLLES